MRSFVYGSLRAVMVILCMTLICGAQVTVGDTTAPPPGVMLEVRSSDKGFLPPRLTGAQMAAIQNPPAGLIIFNTSLNSLMVFQAGSWRKLMVPPDPVPPPVPQIDSSSRCGSGLGNAVDIDDGKAIIGCAAGLSFFRFTGELWVEEKFFPLSGKITAVAILRNFAMAGIPTANKTYCFEFTQDEGWIQTQMIDGPLTLGYKPEQFGFSLAITDSFAIVGDPFCNAKAGAVHIYQKSFIPASPTQKGWVLSRSFTGRSGDEFGHSVDINAQRFVVGEWMADIGGKVVVPDVGMLHVYKRTGNLWQLEEIFTHPDSLQDARFGSGVSISDNIIVSGSQNMDNIPLRKDQSGAVTIFEMLSEGVWTPVANLTLADAGIEELVSNAHFGNCVSLFENRLMVGAYTHPTLIAGAGAVYMFERKYGRWYFRKKLVNKTPEGNGLFGQSVSQFGPYLLVGAPGTRGGKGTIIFFDE